MLFVGDISFSGPVKYYVEHNYHSYNDSFRDVAPFIRGADISVANLESPFVSKDVYRYKYKGMKTVYLYSSPEAASALRFVGFDVVTLANNHLNDFTSKGVNFTVQVLKGVGIKYFGVNYGTFSSSQEPLIMTKNGIKIGFLGYCEFETNYKAKNCSEMRLLFNAGPAVYRDDIATRDVQRLKEVNVDVIVVYMHWGRELDLQPRPYQLRITKHLVSLGVRVIIGSHPHVLQPHFIHGNKLVAYSLGNFLFPPSRTPGGNNPELYGAPGVKPDEQRITAYESYTLEHCENFKLSRILQVTVTRNGVLSAKYIPVRITFDHKTKRLHPEPAEDAKWIDVCGKEDKHCQKSYKN